MREADHIIAECPQEREDLIAYYEAPAEKITIIPCGFNPHEFHPLDRLLARRVVNLDISEYIVLQFGRIVPRKGIDNVIRAMGRIKRTSVPARLVVVGGETDNPDPEKNPEIVRLQKIAAEENVKDLVIFAGRKQRDILKYYYAAADLFITTPWYEPFGITPLESMACGTPVIGSDVGGIKYTVEEGKSGFLVPPNDPDALAVKIYELLHDPKLRTEMGMNAVKRVNSLFTWTKVTEMVAALYEKVVLASRPAVDEAEQAFIERGFDNAVDTFRRAKETVTVPILQAAGMLVKCFRGNNKVLICGNGGSAAESQHLAAELVGRFEMAHRAGLPAISLTADSAVMTAWANDFGYENVFARQVEAEIKARAQHITEYAGALYDKLNATLLAVTLDSDGSIVVENGEPAAVFPAPSVANAHVCGAGDTYLSAFVLSYLHKPDIEISGTIATAAASIAIRKECTSSCSQAELKSYFNIHTKYISDPDHLNEICDAYHKTGKRIVFTNGCFDILHSGHVTYLHLAKQLGDVLIVGLNNDESIKRIKGKNRPINGLADRLKVLAGLSSVDHITAFGDEADDTPVPLIRVVRPHIFAKGGDYTKEKLPEAEIVLAFGGEIVFLDHVRDHSTTRIINRIHQISSKAEKVVSELPS